MKERAVTFGAHGGLVGILTEPERERTAPIAVIVSNIGMHHRVGPFRLYVELARRLADSSVPVLRFDLAGMGDSEPRHESASPSESALRDMEDAMQLLTDTVGAEKFILIGLCSGVDSSHAAAVRDTRVLAAAFIDGYSYPSLGFYIRRFRGSLLQPARWKRFLRRHLGSEKQVEVGDALPQVFVRDHPTRDQFRQDVLSMTRRGVRLLFVFSGGVFYRFNSPRQFVEMLGSRVRSDRIEVDAMYTADHVFTSVAKRDALVERLDRWVRKVVA